MATDPGQDDGVTVDVNGTEAVEQSATVQAQYSGQTVTPTQDFSFAWNGVIANFYANQSVPVDAALLAALQAQGAPINAP